jgi:hypothetical protein
MRHRIAVEMLDQYSATDHPTVTEDIVRRIMGMSM